MNDSRHRELSASNYTPYDFEQLRKKGELSAHEAWAKAMQHADGAWRQGVLGDVLTDRVVETLGGYSVVAFTNTDKLGFLERRFKDAYNDLLESGGVREALPNLTERPRIRNRSPVQIGEVTNLVASVPLLQTAKGSGINPRKGKCELMEHQKPPV